VAALDDFTPASQAEIALAADELSPAELKKARHYGRLNLICDLADKALDVAFLAVMALVVARPLDAWLAGYIAGHTARLAALVLVVMLAHYAISFPLSFYAGFVLEHRFGLSHQSLRRWFSRYAKMAALTVGFSLLLWTGLYWVVWLCGGWWWLAAAGAFFVVGVLLGRLMPVLILPLFFKIEPLENAELSRRMARLAEGTGLSIAGVYRMGISADTRKANAMLAGMGRTRRVLMGDTLLNDFTPDEIEVIFAHEVGHHVFGHIRKMIVLGLVFSAAGFWICDRLLMSWLASSAGPVDYGHLPVYALPLLMLILAVLSLAMMPLANLISRYHERQCDRYAIERTGLRGAFVSAFRKLARLNNEDPSPAALEVFLFHDHPSIAQRLALADES